MRLYALLLHDLCCCCREGEVPQLQDTFEVLHGCTSVKYWTRMYVHCLCVTCHICLWLFLQGGGGAAAAWLHLNRLYVHCFC
jgi:hypothetical protein